MTENVELKKVTLSYKIKDFVRSASFVGIILLICVGVSLSIANSQLGDGFTKLLNATLGYNSNYVHLKYPVLLWINDGLMAIFFLFVGLEIKRELIKGELSTAKKAMLPVFAAFGGAIIPALIFLLINLGKDTVNGWGIPMATDIAFAIGILSLLGSRVPASLKVFLSALAIVDDLIAILVIVIFYSQPLDVSYLVFAGCAFLLMLIFNWLGFKSLFLYLIPGLFVWYFIHHSGIHATIAGVLTAIAIPMSRDSKDSPLEKLEHFLTKPVNLFIMPVFALANTNIRFEPGMFQGLSHSMGIGIIIGLLVGKPIGISLTSWMIVKLGLGSLPQSARWHHIIGIGLLGGIGFTMSFFIALLSFDKPEWRGEAKFAILIASMLSGIAGYLVLRLLKNKTLRNDRDK